MTLDASAVHSHLNTVTDQAPTNEGFCGTAERLFGVVQGPKSKVQVLNFFWVPSSACDLVIATSQGLELYKRLPGNQGLHYSGSKKHSTAWCMYSHEARIALLAAADTELWLQVCSCYMHTMVELQCDGQQQHKMLMLCFCHNSSLVMHDLA